MEIKTTKEIVNSYYGLMEHQNSVQHINPERKETKWVRVDDVIKALKYKIQLFDDLEFGITGTRWTSGLIGLAIVRNNLDAIIKDLELDKKVE